MSNIVADPRETLAVNHTLEPDVYSGIYTLTIHVSLLRQDPLLLASIENFDFIVFRILETGQGRIYADDIITTTENKVRTYNICSYI